MRITSIRLALVLVALAGTGRAEDIDLDAVPRLSARLPDVDFAVVAIRGPGEGRGWMARLPTPTGAEARSEDVRSSFTAPSPVVSGGRVFVGSGFDGWDLFAFRSTNGRHLWTTRLGDNGPSTVAVTPGTVVVNTESCTTYGLAPDRGAVTWSRKVGPHIDAAPTVVGDRVLTAHHGADGLYFLTCLDLGSGEEVWSRQISADVRGAPIPWRDGICLAGRDGVLTSYDLSGRPRWSSRIEAASAPWADRAGLFVATGSGWRPGLPAVRRIDPRDGRTIWDVDPDPHWRERQRDTTSEAATQENTALRTGWHADPPRPVVVGDLCVVAGGRDLVMLDVDSGEEERRLRLPAGRRFHSPPAVLGRTLLFATLDGLLLEIDVSSGGVRRALDLGTRVTAQPVVAEGRAVVVSGDVLISVPWGEADGPSWSHWGGTGARGEIRAGWCVR